MKCINTQKKTTITIKAITPKTIKSITYISTDVVANNVVLGVSIALILLAMKSIFFNSNSKEKMQSKEGILLENDNGKLLVSRDTIESLTNAVVKSFETAESVMTKVEVDEESHVKIYITLFVYPDAIIKDLSKFQRPAADLLIVHPPYFDIIKFIYTHFRAQSFNNRIAPV